MLFFIPTEAEAGCSSSPPTSTVAPWWMELVTDGRDCSHRYQLWWLTVGNNMDHAPGHDLLYSSYTDMTLHPGINLHAGRMCLLLNYVKCLIWVIYYKGFRLSPKMHSKTVSFSLYHNATCQYFFKWKCGITEGPSNTIHHDAREKRGEKWGVKRDWGGHSREQT